MNNKGKYKIGKVTDFAKEKGWFFGHFATDKLLQSDLVEIGWQEVSNKKASPEDKHLHTKSVEINLIIAGEVKVTINGEKHELHKGDFYVIWPETVLENLETSEGTEIIVVKAPSVNDKVMLP
jgi:mannose-6-phosphate isomerase-like protein (cupin superfamily)